MKNFIALLVLMLCTHSVSASTFPTPLDQSTELSSLMATPQTAEWLLALSDDYARIPAPIPNCDARRSCTSDSECGWDGYCDRVFRRCFCF